MTRTASTIRWQTPEPRRRGRDDAFTLIELLVVIGIIALLISILMPALSAARRSALSTRCLATQRQIGAAAQMHVVEHRGYYPLAGFFADLQGEPEDFRDSNKLKYKYILWNRTFGGDQDFQLRIAPWHTALASYMTKRRILDHGRNDAYIADEHGEDGFLKYFLCPADVDKPVDAEECKINYHGLSNRSWTLRQSFVVNEAVFGVDDQRGRLRGQASRVRDPARTFMLMDGKGAPLYSETKWVTLPNAVKLETPVNGSPINSISLGDALLGTNGSTLPGSKESFNRDRHKNKINILFMDGHCETHVIDERDLASVFVLAPSRS